jgi:hypothetical protein
MTRKHGLLGLWLDREARSEDVLYCVREGAPEAATRGVQSGMVQVGRCQETPVSSNVALVPRGARRMPNARASGEAASAKRSASRGHRVACAEEAAAAVDCRWDISGHAVERWIQRVDVTATPSDAANAITADSAAAHLVKRQRNGLDVWRGPKPRRARFLVCQGRLVTVMGAYDGFAAKR